MPGPVAALLKGRTQQMHKGFTLWFTGMSGAGKSTIAGLIETGGPRRPRTFLTWDQIRNEFFLSLKYS